MDTISDDMKNLPNETVKNALTEILDGYFSSEKYSLTIENGSEKGDNYIGIVYRAIAFSEPKIDSDSDEKKILSIVIKVAPENLMRRRQFFVRPSFLRESLVYDEILPMLMEYQKSKGVIPDKNGFHEVAKCYGCIVDEMTEAIFMEDLRTEGFDMFSRFNLIHPEHVNVVFRILAKFHAISLAIKDQCPEKLEKFRTMEDVFASRATDDQMLTYFEESKRIAFLSLEKGKDEYYIERLKNFLEKDSYLNLLMHVLNGRNAEPHAVICHGDFWNNNILFKNENGRPIDARFIDWQIARYASPVTDLTYYLFACTTKEYRDKYYFQALDIYYSELSAQLKRLGSNPEKVFSRKDLDSQLKQFGSFGLLMSIIVLPIITNQAEDVPDLDELSEKVENGGSMIEDAAGFYNSKNKSTYSKKMREIIIDNVKLGYI